MDDLVDVKDYMIIKDLVPLFRINYSAKVTKVFDDKVDIEFENGRTFSDGYKNILENVPDYLLEKVDATILDE